MFQILLWVIVLVIRQLIIVQFDFQCQCLCVYSHVELEENAQTIGQSSLQYLSILKREKPGSGTIASAANDLQKTIRSLGRLAGVNSTYIAWLV